MRYLILLLILSALLVSCIPTEEIQQRDLQEATGKATADSADEDLENLLDEAFEELELVDDEELDLVDDEELDLVAGDTVTTQPVAVEITSSGFSPKLARVEVGQTVTFVNKDSRSRWPASDIHPTHTLYPGSSIQKCGTDELIFDACTGLAPGAEFSFSFDRAGTWRYHDHLAPATTGTIIVE